MFFLGSFPRFSMKTNRVTFSILFEREASTSWGIVVPVVH
jgi:hypothetical protein